MDAALTADEYDSSPVALFHSGYISATETYTAEHIDFEEAPPIFIRNFLKGFRLINSKVVNENVHGGKAFGQVSCRLRRRQVPRESVNVGLRNILTDLFQGRIDRSACSSVYNYTCTFRGELAGNREADA